MSNIVFSGFKKFGAYQSNPTEEICNVLDGKALVGLHVTSFVFDCVISDENRGRFLLSRAQELGACGVVSLGMASEKTGICLEGRGRNAIDNQKYCRPDQIGTRVDDRYEYGSTLDCDLSLFRLPEFRQRCTGEGIPVMDLSIDAGGFCCNQLLFQLEVAKREGVGGVAAPFVFIHLPCSLDSVVDRSGFLNAGKTFLSVDESIRGLKILLETASL